jgi:adenylylsulfate reductase subunit A
MQNVMDRYAGGIGSDYRYTERSLSIADTKIRKLEKAAKALTAADMQELSYVMELRERLTLCRFLIAHLAARKETRWRSFAEHLDHPGKSDAWLRYVNSSLGAEGKPRIIYRDLVKEDEVYIHG